MSKMQFEIFLYNEKRHYGSRGVSPRKQNTVAANKFKQLLGSKGVSNTNKVPQFGGGNITKHSIFKGEADTNDIASVDEAVKYVQVFTSRFESLPSNDVYEKKHAYSKFKNSKIEEYNQKYGETLSEAKTDALLNELSTKSFNYVQSQMTIVITSDEEFEGSHKKGDQYVRVLRTKRIYRMNEVGVTATEIAQLSSLEDMKVKVVKTLNRKSSLVKNDKGNYVIRIDFGDLMDQEYGDSYF